MILAHTLGRSVNRYRRRLPTGIRPAGNHGSWGDEPGDSRRQPAAAAEPGGGGRDSRAAGSRDSRRSDAWRLVEAGPSQRYAWRRTRCRDGSGTWLIVLVAALVVLGVAAAGGWYFYQRSRRTSSGS